MTYTQYYTPTAILDILNKNQNPVYCRQSKQMIMNEAISFDIESTSTYLGGKKIAFMYAWAFDIFGCTIIGRYWEEFVYVLQTISNFYSLNPSKRIICYVHNLAYDLQFFRKWLTWVKMFATDTRKPLYAISDIGIEFRCSYRLSGYKLSKIGEQIGIEKLPDYKYEEIRTPLTPLSKMEREYIIHDVKIVSAYIRKKISEESGIINIPLTKTGYVRRLYRHRCLNNIYTSPYYKAMIHNMTLTYDEYLTAKKAFAGGYTHTAWLHSGKLRKNVKSFDFNSSYPTVLIAERYPMSKAKHIENVTKEELSERLESDECAIVTLTLANVKCANFPHESYLSESRCEKCLPTKECKKQINNGRIFSAGFVVTTITNVDFQIMKAVYTFDIIGYCDFYVFESNYLPTSFIECLLELYKKKTELKGVKGKEDEYMNAKENLNSSYGMTVTDIVREIIEYDFNLNEWDDILRIKNHEPPKRLTEEQIEEQLTKENKKQGRFIFYLWGVFCTAYARRNLWIGILSCGSDYIYSDTDSIKLINAVNHMDFINNYNKWISERLETAMRYHRLDTKLLRPKNIFGEEKPLGLWDNDGDYTLFKAIRAKSYAYKKRKPEKIKIRKSRQYSVKVYPDKTPNWKRNHKIMYDVRTYHMTVAGVNGNLAMFYLIKKNPYKPLDLFTEKMHIPAEYSGKLTHTYIDDSFSAIVYDSYGVPCAVHEKSYVHLEPATYDMSEAVEYARFLAGAKDKYDL